MTTTPNSETPPESTTRTVWTMTTSPITYRKKPVEIQAMEFATNNDNGSCCRNIVEWIRGNGGLAETDQTVIRIQTLEGIMTAEVRDQIIRGVAGEFYPCKPDIFTQTYERVERLTNG